jgi:hypothetical protein
MDGMPDGPTEIAAAVAMPRLLTRGAKRAGHRHLLAMPRRKLDELPETDHPLGR